MAENGNGTSGRSWVYWLLVIPVIAVLWVPFYNSVDPVWEGIPYFYWYQFLWVLLNAGIIGLVYFLTERH